MDRKPDRQITPPGVSIEEISTAIWALAEKDRGDSLRLLSLLRSIEQLHRQIRVELFEPCLPQTRQHLYQLAKEIEESGGWPYIERMRLRELLKRMDWEESSTIQNLADESVSEEG